MKKLLSAILILAMVLSLMPALSLRSQAAETSYAEFWVDPDTGDDANEGTQAAPFKTITKAKEVVSTIAPAMTGDIIVHLGGGTYTLSDTINFTAADSGCNGFKVIYKAVEGETPLLSGGTLISNWEVHDADKNIFVADVPEGLEDGRHFFVDGEYATHAMTEDAPIDWKIMSSYGYVSPTVDSADNEEYVIMDLGEEKLVGQLVLYPYTLINADGKAAGFPEDFTIETSVDGINYTVQKTVTDYAAPSLGAGQEFKFTAVNARYVKLNVTKLGKAPVATADQYCLGLAEFQVFAAKKLDMSNAAANVDFSTNLLGIVKEQYSENLLLGASGDRLECMGQFNASNDFEGAPFVADGFDDTRANLFDGDVNTLVETKMYYSAWVNANQTLGLRINLTSDNGKPMKIAAVSLSAPNGGSPNTFKIQLATAAEPTADDWVTVVDTGNVKFADQSTHMFTFPETEAYKLRILCSNLNWQQWVGAPYFYYGNLQIADIAVHELVKEPAYNDDWNLLYGASGDILECFGLFNESDGYAGTDAIADEYLNSHANLFDGKVETLMASPTYRHIDMGTDKFGFRINLTSDDGKPTRISAVSLSAPNGGSPQSFVIQVATAADPTEADWVTVAEDSNTKWAEVSTRVYEFAAIKAYKLRVLCSGINWPYYNPPIFSGPFQVADIGVYDLPSPAGYNDDWNLLYEAEGDRLECMGQFNASNDFEGAPYVADGFDATRVNLFDGDVNTLVATKSYYSAWVNANQTLGLRINLTTDGEPMKISAVSLTAPNGGSPNTFKIQLATAAEPTADDWVTVVDTGNVKFAEQSTHVFTFPETEAYKLRILCSNLNWQQWVGAPYFFTGNLQIADIGVYNLPESAFKADNIEIFGKFESADGFAGSDFIATSNSLKDLIDEDMETIVSTPAYQSELLIPGESSFGVLMNVTQDGAPTSIGAVKIGANVGGINSPRDFRIQVATAAEPTENDWQTVVTMEDYDWSNGDTATFIFDAVDAYKVRLLVDDLNWETDDGDGTYSGAFQLAELAVYAAAESATLAEKENLVESAINYGYYFGGGLVEKGSLHSLWPIKNLYDDNKNSIVSTNSFGYDNLTVSGGQSALGVRVDLEGDEPVVLDAIEITVREPGICNPLSFEVQVTADHNPKSNADWVTVIREENFEWSEATVLFPIQSIEAVQVRLIATEICPDAYDGYYLQLGELKALSHVAPEGDIVDFRTPVDSAYGELITNGKITVKNNNTDPEHCADTMIDGFAIDVAQDVGYYVPESYGMKDWMSTEDLEVHYSYHWYQGHYSMTPALNDGTVIYIDNHLVQSVYMPAWLEGAYEFINVPGEWYIHRAENKIYYKASGTMDGKTAVLGNLETLVNFDHCSNVTFDGVEFAHTTWTFPTEQGYYDTQSGFYYTGLEWHIEDNTAERHNPPAAIEMYYASNITITNAEIHNIGSHAVDIGEGSCNNEISNSLIYDVAGRAVGVGWLHAQDAECTFPESHKVQDNLIRNNYITRIGLDYFDNSAICVSLANGTIVEHNEVAYVPYTGIDMGWGWNWWKVACQGENIVRYNYVHHAGQMVNDGGAIYTLGNEVGSEVYGNYVHDYGDLSNSKNMALYLDNGSNHISLYENVVGENVYWWGSMYASEINNCVWRDNYYLEGRFRDNGHDNTVENNVFMETGNISDYPEAQAIVDNAGLLDVAMKARVPEGAAAKHVYKMRVYPTHEETYYLSVETLVSATIPGQLGTTIYDWNAKTATINMPKTADLTALVPELVLANGYTCDLAAGTVVDFTTPLTVVISGERTEEWTITAKILELADTPIEGPLEGVEVTLDDAIANPGDWTVAPTQNADGSITFSQGIYFSTYIGGEDQGVFEKNTIFKFDILLPNLNNQQKDWIGFSISADNTSTYNGNQYNIYFNNVTVPFDNNIELQKWIADGDGSHREMLVGSITNYPGKFGDMPNLYLTPGVRHSIVTGAVETEGGMRLFLFVDGNLVFNVVDDTNPHAEGGYFQIHPVTGDVTLYPYSDIYKVYADFSELDVEIANAEAVDPDLYTEESYAALVEVLEAAKELRQDMYARQTLVDETAQALRDAIAALKTPVDYTALEEAIAKAEAVDAEEYTEESYAALAEALEAAKAVLENADATQEEVDAATEALNAALEALLTPADTSALEEAIAKAEAVDAEEYTEESYAALAEALEAAKAVLENTDATQEEVDAATEALNAALEALEETKVPDDSNGKTGDDSLIMAFALLMILSAAAICAIITLNKRMNIR